MTFEVTDSGPAGGRTVIALHGFPEDRSCWDPLAAGLAPAGYRVLAPDQRGYSPAARPSGWAAYTIDELAADVLALADEGGADRFDLVGHDWGAVVAWWLAAHRPDRVRSLTALSVPHPSAFRQALLHSDQLLRSWYAVVFQVPFLAEAAFRVAGPAAVARVLERDGLDPGSARRYAARVGQPGAMTGPLNWYRALPATLRGASFPLVEVPTLHVWSRGDPHIARYGPEHTARYVTGPYRFEILPGSHWLPSEAAGELVPLVLAHLRDS